MASYTLQELLNDRQKGEKPWYSNTYRPMIENMIEIQQAVSSFPVTDIPSPQDTRNASTTAGTGNAYTASPATTVISYGDMNRYFLRVHATNSGACTLDISSLGAVPWLASDGTPLSVNELKVDAMIIVAYSTALNAFINVTSTKQPVVVDQFAVGDVKDSFSPSQTNWLIADGLTIGDVGTGADYEGAEYEALFNVLSPLQGAFGSLPVWGVDPCRLPDFRACVGRGMDNMGGTSRGVITDSWASELGGTGGAGTITLNVGQLPAHNHGGVSGSGGGHTHTASTNTTGNHTHTYGLDQGSAEQGVKDKTIIQGTAPDITGTTSTSGNHSHTVSVGWQSGHTHTIASQGSGDSVKIVSPSIAMYKLIKY